MAVLRMQVSKLLFILFVIGFIANDVNGDCPRPVFTNPYAITFDPDQQAYSLYYKVVFYCEEGHTPNGLPDYYYCQYDSTWDLDISDGRCYAQCNTTKLISDDDVKVTDDSGVQQTVFNHGENANFACTNKSQSSGSEKGTCNNGTLTIQDEPSCLAYCPIYLDELGVGLYYDIADTPVINETSTLYYEDGKQITYRCVDGYEGPQNRTPSDDGKSTCNDGSWDPPGIPTCMVMTTAEMVTTMELPTSMDMTTIADQSTIALTTTKASTTEGLPTSLPNSTPPLTTRMTPPDSSTTSVVSPGLTTVTPDATSITPGLTTVTPDAMTITPDLTTVGTGVTVITPDATSITPGLTTVTPGATTVTPDATSITPDSTTAGSSLTTVTPDATSITPGLTTVTPDAMTITPDLTTVGTGVTTVTPDATSITPDSSTAGSGLTTVTPDAMTITPDLTTVGSGLPTVTPDAMTATPAISTETAPPTVPESTTKSDSTTSSNPTSLLPETTETVSVRSTSPGDPTDSSPTESRETTASQKTSPATPERTEKPPTTPLPCGGECKATQLCNADNNCECRPDYYEDEDEEDPENPCKEPESIDVTIKITNAEYDVKLEDQESLEFQNLESDVCEPFEEIYKNDTEYIGCRVLEFSSGSIIVNYVLTFAENSNQSASTVNTTVQEELQKPNGSFAGNYTFDDSSLVVAPLDECTKKIDTCDPDNAECIDQGADGYICECHEGFDDVGIPKSLPGRECMKPTDPRTTEEPQEPGLEPWKVVVGVTVPIISILTITIVGLTCWQYRRLHRTSPKSAMTKMRTFPYEDDTRGSSDRRASRPESMMIMNNDGTVQEVVLPWRNIPAEEEFIFAPDNGKGRTQMLPTVDYPSDYAGSASYDNDPLGNIVGSYDNYTYQHHDMTNSTEIDSKYF